MKRVDFGSVVATVATRLVLTGAIATTLTVFAQVPKAYAMCGDAALHEAFRDLNQRASQLPPGAEREQIQQQIKDLARQAVQAAQAARQPSTGARMGQAARQASTVSTPAIQTQIRSIRDSIQRGR